MRRDFLSTIQRVTAISAVGPSAVRNQGKGVQLACHEFLGSLDLATIPRTGESSYGLWLDEQTEALLNSFPLRHRPWGTARKAVNLFMRDAFRDRFLASEFRLDKLEPWLEIPLDKAVAKGIRDRCKHIHLPLWPGLKHLLPDASADYQAAAKQIARDMDVSRVHLDMYLWLENR